MGCFRGNRGVQIMVGSFKPLKTLLHGPDRPLDDESLIIMLRTSPPFNTWYKMIQRVPNEEYPLRRVSSPWALLARPSLRRVPPELLCPRRWSADDLPMAVRCAPFDRAVSKWIWGCLRSWPNVEWYAKTEQHIPGPSKGWLMEIPKCLLETPLKVLV